MPLRLVGFHPFIEMEDANYVCGFSVVLFLCLFANYLFMCVLNC